MSPISLLAALKASQLVTIQSAYQQYNSTYTNTSTHKRIHTCAISFAKQPKFHSASLCHIACDIERKNNFQV